MVWWTNTNLQKVGPWFGFKASPDVVYQSINVMFDCHESDTNGFYYYSLVNVGVNIFNVDLTKHDMDFFNAIKEGITGCDTIAELYPTGYYRPVGLSVMMSVKEPLEVDDMVDIIILKDITKAEELLEFRKRNKKFSSMPILSWPPHLRIEDLNELIKKSAGIVLDQSFGDGACGIVHVLQASREAYKPVFHFEPNMIHDYHDDIFHAQLRRILTYAHNIVNYGLDGYIVMDCVGKQPNYVVQSLVKAMEMEQKKVQCDKEFFKRSYQTPLPALAPTSSAFGASIAALKSKAKAIVVLTKSGASARILAYTSPPCRIIAVTAHESRARRLHLYKKVIPLYYNKKRKASWHAERWARVVFGTRFGLEIGLYSFAAKLVVLSPFEEGVGYCDNLEIVEVSDVLNKYCE